MAATRPKLPALKTPTTATFPLSFPGDALLSASSVRTPLSALSFKGPMPSAGLYSSGLPSAGLPSAPLEYPPTPSMLSAKPFLDDKPEKTPITPPLAYMDFLKTINPASPAIASPPLTAPLPVKAALKRTATSDSTDSVETTKSEESRESATEEDDLDSAPTTASSISTTTSDCSCLKQTTKSSKPAPIFTRHAASPAGGVYPLSAPATGPTTFPSLRVPPSPALDNATPAPWSARSIKSPFDWDAALKAKRYTEVVPAGPTSAGPAPGYHSSRCEKKGTSIRHIREVVTRTVTYTPRMEPAPRGKRRKLNDEVEAAE